MESNKSLSMLCLSIVASIGIVGCTSSSGDNVNDHLQGKDDGLIEYNFAPVKDKSVLEGNAYKMLSSLETRTENHTEPFPENLKMTHKDPNYPCSVYDDYIASKAENATIMTSDGCNTSVGDVKDDYSGEKIDLAERGDDVVVDAPVSFQDAWVSGAHQWDEDKIADFFDDPLNMMITTRDIQADRNGVSAEAWLAPSENGKCELVSRQVALKDKYGLSVTAPEFTAMAHSLDTCKITEIQVLDD